MPVILFLLIAITTAVHLYPPGQQQYTAYLNIPNSNNYTRAEYSTDMTLLLLYDRGNTFANVFSGFNYSAISDQVYSKFAAPPNSIAYFVDQNGFHNFLFGTTQGDIFRKQIRGRQPVYSRLWVIDDESNDVAKVLPSPNQQVFAAYCSQAEKVYIGDLQEIQKIIKELNYTGEGIVRNIRWRSNTNQLAVTGGNSSAAYFLLYDYKTQEETDLTGLAEGVVVDVAFSSTGRLMYFVEGEDNSTHNENFVKIWDFQREVLRYLVAVEAEEFRGVTVRGNFVSAWDDNFVYVWDRVTELFYGRYQSQLASGGLSPDGSELLTLTLGPISHITLYKLCQDDTHVYSPLSDSCISCVIPCLGCFLQQTHCSSCIAQYYLTASFVCEECIENCKNCSNATGCSQCLPAYFYSEKKCRSCESAIRGCVLCVNGTYCTFCQWEGHWVLDQTHSCVCATGYVQTNFTCQPCPEHCLQCEQSAGSCQICDGDAHWVSVNGSCVCSNGFYPLNQTCLECSLGCISCSSSELCLTCDSSLNWVLSNHSCVCQFKYTQVDAGCRLCSQLMEGCSKCSSQHVCQSCHEGYELERDSNQCQPSEGHTALFIVLGIVGGLLLVGLGVFFLRRYLLREQTEKMKTLLESQEEGRSPTASAQLAA